MQNVAFDLGYLARLDCASHEMNRDVTWSLQFSSPQSQAEFHLFCGVPAKPDWNEAWTSQKAEPPFMLRVYLILLLLCVFGVSHSRTATYCFLPVFAFEKAATVSWLLCNSECVFVDAGVWQLQHRPGLVITEWISSCFCFS